MRDAMRNVHFDLHGGSYSYAGFYDGFGLAVSVYVVFLAFLAWHLGDLARRNPSAVGGLGWMFCAMQVAQLAICMVYFFTLPIVLATVLSLCLGLAAWRVRASV